MHLFHWARVKRMLNSGVVMMVFQFADTPERMQQYELAGPTRTGSMVFTTTRKTAIHNWRDFEDLTTYVIGQVRGYAYKSKFDKDSLRRDINTQNPRQLVSMLLAGQIDIIVGDRMPLIVAADRKLTQ